MTNATHLHKHADTPPQDPDRSRDRQDLATVPLQKWTFNHSPHIALSRK
jgi:hypothetical protein